MTRKRRVYHTKKRAPKRRRHYYDVGGISTRSVVSAKLSRIKDGELGHRYGAAIEYVLRMFFKGDPRADAKKAKDNIDWAVARYVRVGRGRAVR